VNSTGGEGDCAVGGPNGARRGCASGGPIPNCGGSRSTCPGNGPPHSPVEIPNRGWGWESADLPTAGPVVIDHDLHEVNTPITALVRTQRRARVSYAIPELSEGSSDDISEYEMKEEGDTSIRDGDMHGVRHVYKDETWSTKFFTYDPKPKEFRGRMGTTKFFAHMPSLLTLFELFWPFNLLRKIVIETNRYASHVVDALGNTIGGPKWVHTSVAELKAFLAIHMYMGMKCQPNIKSYWSKEGSIFHCPTISNIMT
jgi:hypothetical protein